MKRLYSKFLIFTLMVFVVMTLAMSALAATNIETIVIDGSSYRFPCRLEAFLENGWRVSSNYQEWLKDGDWIDRHYSANDTVPAGCWCRSLSLEKNGMTFDVLLCNSSQSKKLSRMVVSQTVFCKYSRTPSVSYLGIKLDHASIDEIGRAVRSANG